MKANKLYLALISLVFTFSFSSCGDDNGDDMPVVETPKPLSFDKDTVIVGVNETATFNITNGGGDYKVVNENPDIASATISGTEITVTSQQKGITGLVVSDAAGNYKRVMVKSMYFTMALDTESVNIGIKLGHTDGHSVVTVTEGNGEYSATCADENVAKVSSVSGDKITIQAVSNGSTTITVTDMMGLKKTVNVTVETTTIPFTEEEKEEIMNDNSNFIVWDTESSFSFGTFKAKDDNGQKLVYWDYYGYYYFKVWFDGDLSVGKKTNGKFMSLIDWGGDPDIFSPVDVEIIKNDGNRVWGLVSTIKDNYLYCGYFSVPAN